MTPVQIVLITLSVVSSLLSLGAFVRAGRWRESDEGKKLEERVLKTENRLISIETKMQDMPSKADVAVLQSTSQSNHELITRSLAAITRVENWMIGTAK